MEEGRPFTRSATLLTVKRMTVTKQTLTAISLRLRSFSLLSRKKQVEPWQLNSAGLSLRTCQSMIASVLKLTKRHAKTLQHGRREKPGKAYKGKA